MSCRGSNRSKPLRRGTSGGGQNADVIAAFSRFLHPADVVGAWGEYGPSLFVAAGGALPARLDLRVVGQRLSHQKLGGLEAYAASLDGPLPSLPVPGRAGRRLAMLAKIVASWRESTFTPREPAGSRGFLGDRE